MKRVKVMMLLLVSVAMLAIGCDREKPRILSDGAMLYINVKQGNMRAIEGEVTPVEGDEFKRLTPRELVEKAGAFFFFDKTMKNSEGGYGKESAIGIADEQKDVENERIKMWGEQIVNEDGTLNTYWIELRDIRIGLPIAEGNVGGYIPNSVMERAEKDIKAAYADGNIDEVYRLFHEAFTAIPCTEKEWMSLKERGLQ